MTNLLCFGRCSFVETFTIILVTTIILVVLATILYRILPVDYPDRLTQGKPTLWDWFEAAFFWERRSLGRMPAWFSPSEIKHMPAFLNWINVALFWWAIAGLLLVVAILLSDCLPVRGWE